MSVDISKLIKSGDVLKITKPDGTIMFIEIDTVDDYDAMDGMASQFTLNPNTHNFQYKIGIIAMLLVMV